ncbi:MAG: molybdopterin-dependent oxidoreductase [Chloroflexi bacterium]|nr:molybdopterin-dependent oxidoreductase [Chloroflexota bacterium]
MADLNSQVTRRGFLKTSAFGAGALLFADDFMRSLSESLVRLGVPAPWYRKGQISTTYNYCDMCPWSCGIVVKSVNGRVYKIDGNPKDPKSRGKLCARGQAGVSHLYDPDRLKQPMIRTGARGDPASKFKTATWDEALDHAAEKMLAIKDQYGPEAVAFFGHTSGNFWLTDYLSQAWGSPNSAKPSVSMCTSPREEAALITFGRSIGNHEPVDWNNTQAVVLIGTHIGEDARNTTMQDLANARARGAKLIVVDPRYSSAAMKADYWLPIKPGTDTALLLAWMNVLIAEKLYDAEFIQNWTVGFEQLAEHVKPFTPEWAAAITELPADQISASARELGRHKPQSVIVPGRHVVWYGNDTQRMRAVYIINGLLGAYGRRGGLYFNKSPYLEEIPHPPFAAASGAGG